MLRALPQGVRTLFLSFLFEMFLDRLIERIIFVTRFLQWNNAVPLLPLYKLVLPRHWEQVYFLFILAGNKQLTGIVRKTVFFPIRTL